EHGPNDGNSDVRLRLVMDDGRSSVSLLTNKAATLALLGMDEAQMKAAVDEDGQMAFVQTLRGTLLGRTVKATGRTIVDEQGAMMLADGAAVVEEDAGMLATELRAHWGVS
ncbi:hypothetical protein N9N12_01970, partial [Candidatus Poseidoniales archaeon]|nr:hypothetical protein [Candidatus Poseidoniales archaeon]